jgi:hypothetical protein
VSAGINTPYTTFINIVVLFKLAYKYNDRLVHQNRNINGPRIKSSLISQLHYCHILYKWASTSEYLVS